MTVLGCVGAINQTEREGCCSGRRTLGLYQICLCCLLGIAFVLALEAKQTADSIDFTINNGTSTTPTLSGMPYDKFENKAAPFFNSFYFDALCEENPEDSEFLKLVDKHCPAAITLDNCVMSNSGSPPFKEDVCNEQDQVCGDTWDKECCPDQNLCDVAMEEWKVDGEWDGQALKACPYHQCRRAALKFVYYKLEPTTHFAMMIFWVILVVLFLTCLLICYRPRDDLTEELIKTGVVVEKRKGQKKTPFRERKQTRTSDAPPLKGSSRGRGPSSSSSGPRRNGGEHHHGEHHHH